ncbi:MAG: CsbD family protein [Terracidiphilus sp.]
MNKDRVIGTMDQVVGRAKRKAGELTGDTRLQVAGMVQQVNGQVENAWGLAKDLVRDSKEGADLRQETRVEVERERSAVDTDRSANR